MGFVPFGDEEVASMRACGITRIVPDPGSPVTLEDWPMITAGPALQVEHLGELGHRRIAFAATADPRASLLLGVRVRAAQRAAGRLGLDPLEVQPVDHGGDPAGDVVRRWRHKGVTGVVAYNDHAAAMVVGAALRAGVSVPGDLAVIGHDDSPPAAMFVPSISSVRIDTLSLGRYFADLALHESEGRPLPWRNPAADVTVIARESTRVAQ